MINASFSFYAPEKQYRVYSGQLLVLPLAHACYDSPRCHLVAAQALQAAKFHHAGVTDLGEAMAKALETTARGAFKHSTLFGENRMILENSEKEIWL